MRWSALAILAALLLSTSARAADDTMKRLALGEARFEQKNYPAALAAAEAVLSRDPLNKEALALKHFSEGRIAISGESADEPPSRPARRFRFVAPDPATLPFKLPIKIAPAAAPPDFVAGGAAPAAPGPLPLLPLAEAAALGLAAYEVSRSRKAYESADGLDDEHPKPVGLYQRLVAGAILAGAAGAVVYTLGAVAVSAAPVALGYATGAINSGEIKVANQVPQTLARVIAYFPGQEPSDLIGLPGRPQAFVTAAEDIEGLTAQQLQTRLGILPAPQYMIIRFPSPQIGLATPIDHIDPQFIGEGLTTGGAREFFIPNGPVPLGATYEIVK